jgi:hypothetical protein
MQTERRQSKNEHSALKASLGNPVSVTKSMFNVRGSEVEVCSRKVKNDRVAHLLTASSNRIPGRVCKLMRIKYY